MSARFFYSAALYQRVFNLINSSFVLLATLVLVGTLDCLFAEYLASGHEPILYH